MVVSESTMSVVSMVESKPSSVMLAAVPILPVATVPMITAMIPILPVATVPITIPTLPIPMTTTIPMTTPPLPTIPTPPTTTSNKPFSPSPTKHPPSPPHHSPARTPTPATPTRRRFGSAASRFCWVEAFRHTDSQIPPRASASPRCCSPWRRRLGRCWRRARRSNRVLFSRKRPQFWSLWSSAAPCGETSIGSFPRKWPPS